MLRPSAKAGAVMVVMDDSGGSDHRDSVTRSDAAPSGFQVLPTARIPEPRHRSGAEERSVSNDPMPFSLAYGAVMGWGNGAGSSVNSLTASGVSAVYACVNVMANMVSTLPMRLQRNTDTGTEIVTNHPAAFAVTDATDLHTASERNKLMGIGKHLGGNGYCRVWRNRMGGPMELEWINPFFVQPFRPPNTRMVAYHVAGEKDPLSRYNMIHVKCFSLDGITGLSPVFQLRESIGTSIAQTQAAGRMMRNGATFPGYLKAPSALSKEKVMDARQEWAATNGGVLNAGRPPILWGDWDFKQTSGMSMVDAQFLESRRFELEEIARFYGIPSFMINDTTKTTSWGTGMQEIMETWLKVSLDAELVHWEDSFSYTLLTYNELRSGMRFKFDRHRLLETTPQKQADFLMKMRSVGAYSVDDVRRKIGENDLQDPAIGKDYTLPFNNTGGAAAAKGTAPIPNQDEPLTE